MVQLVKDPALSLLWHGFDPWPSYFFVPEGPPKQNKKKILSASVKSYTPWIPWVSGALGYARHSVFLDYSRDTGK